MHAHGDKPIKSMIQYGMVTVWHYFYRTLATSKKAPKAAQRPQKTGEMAVLTKIDYRTAL
jgi:hypothetical protein